MLNLSTAETEEEGRRRTWRKTSEADVDVVEDGDTNKAPRVNSFRQDVEGDEAVLSVAAACRGEVGDVDEAAAALGGRTGKIGRGERWRREGGEESEARVWGAEARL